MRRIRDAFFCVASAIYVILSFNGFEFNLITIRCALIICFLHFLEKAISN